MPSSPENPYASPRASRGEFEVPPEVFSEARSARQARLEDERIVTTFGRTVFVMSGLLLMWGGVVALVMGLSVFASVGVPTGLSILVGYVALPIGGMVVGNALERLQPWARGLAGAFIIPLGVVAPVGTWLALRMRKTLSSPAGTELFSDAYSRTRALTPYLHGGPRNGVVLGVVGSVVGAVVVLVVGVVWLVESTPVPPMLYPDAI